MRDTFTLQVKSDVNRRPQHFYPFYIGDILKPQPRPDLRSIPPRQHSNNWGNAKHDTIWCPNCHRTNKMGVVHTYLVFSFQAASEDIGTWYKSKLKLISLSLTAAWWFGTFPWFGMLPRNVEMLAESGHPTASTSPQLWGSFRHFKLAFSSDCCLRMPTQLRLSPWVCCGFKLRLLCDSRSIFGIMIPNGLNMSAQRQHNVQHATYLWWRLFCWTEYVPPFLTQIDNIWPMFWTHQSWGNLGWWI